MLCTALLSLTLALPLPTERTPAEILKEIRAKGNAVPVAVLEELAGLGTTEALEALIKGVDAISKVEKVCAAYRVIGQFEGDAETVEDAVEYLAECADGKQERLALHAVWQLGSLWPDSQEALVKLALEHATADGRSFAVMHLVENGMPLSDKQLDRLVRAKDAETRYEGLLARAAGIEDEGKRAREIEKRMRSKDAIERLVAVELLATEEMAGRFEFLSKSLADKDGRVARKASASLERTRRREAIGLLIARLAEAQSGERFRLSQALERLTGKSLGREAGRWQRWWKAEGADFEVPDSPFAREEQPPVVAGDGMTTSFYGMPIMAQRLVFAIDASDSMKAPAGGDADSSRMQVAKAELVKRTYTEGELLLIDLCIGESCGCRISVSGLSPEVREALLGVMERVFDAHFEIGPQRLLVRNTSLCDGPDPDECPIVIDARTGGLEPEPELFRVGVRFGATECTGECGGVRELDFELPLGHRTDRVSVRQGEIGNQGASHFANLRSWNGCTDEPDTVTWVHWLE